MHLVQKDGIAGESIQNLRTLVILDDGLFEQGRDFPVRGLQLRGEVGLRRGKGGDAGGVRVELLGA